MTKQAEPPPPGDKPVGTAPPPPSPWRHSLWPLAILLFILLYLLLPVRAATSVSLSYSQWLSDVSAHKVKSVSINASGDASGTLTDGKSYTTLIPPLLVTPALSSELVTDGVSITGVSSSESFGEEVLIWIILLAPFILIGYFWIRLSRRAGGQLQGALGVGKSKAKVFDEERPKTTFADVAGYDGVKEEITETVDFLRNPGRYRAAGAMAPRGVLMVGPPGTGKTLIARAVAGEANVPFFSVTGSSFVEMFVGVGAARVRDLFAEARKRAPAIVFVDEIDAIGQRRAGSGAMVANDEREQTLNQLLAEMDGFDISEGIVVLAATNRPEVLDPALLRPGRFDRQVTIPLPTLDERVAILRVHCKDKRLGPDVDLDVVARGTPGFSGADLANLVNEAAICAVRDNRQVVEARDFDDARDRIILGRREGSNVLLPDEKHAVAVHEAGHALVAALSPKADPVAKITILPAGQALGVTEQLPLVERHLYGEDYLHDALAVRLGGRAAELVELGQGSTGAANDLASATDLAVKMVREFGLSSELGPVGYPEGGSVFLGGGGPGLSSRPFAEATQAMIDNEVTKLLREAEDTAVRLLTDHRDALRRLSEALVAKETLDGAEVYAIAGVPEPAGLAGGTTVAPQRAAIVAQAAEVTHPGDVAHADGGKAPAAETADPARQL
ncbi:MAG TPA: ATP-dependent zinc metalloprotease FtsH [Acidimicrobiales bacterium]|nr:ATP-dependent zinc metalloprotease FtsH [Acidimicrobiales bacterium]